MCDMVGISLDGDLQMSRVRSPSYPSVSLKEAIASVRDLFEAERFNPVDRGSAAKVLGYSGLTGSSNRLLADLSAYGLIERIGKGELRVSKKVAQILHPEDHSEYVEALALAAGSPPLFKQLRDRFPETLPGTANLEGALVRMGFSSAATKPAAKAFLDTFRFLQEESVSESHREQPVAVLESGGDDSQPDDAEPARPQRRRREARPGMKEAVFPLREGDVVLQVPEHLSGSSLETVKKWLDLVLLQINVDESSAPASSASSRDEDRAA